MSFISTPENYRKIQVVFTQHADCRGIVAQKNILRLLTMLGLNCSLFTSELETRVRNLEFGLKFEDFISLLDLLLSSKIVQQRKLEAFQVLDRHGTGTISSSKLLAILKKQLPAKQYESYAVAVSSSFGASINYIQLLDGRKKSQRV